MSTYLQPPHALKLSLSIPLPHTLTLYISNILISNLLTCILPTDILLTYNLFTSVSFLLYSSFESSYFRLLPSSLLPSNLLISIFFQLPSFRCFKSTAMPIFNSVNDFYGLLRLATHRVVKKLYSRKDENILKPADEISQAFDGGISETRSV